MNKKVGIITWHYFPNFGSALQAYALQTSIEKLGCQAEIINYRDLKYGHYSFRIAIKEKIKYFLCNTLPQGALRRRFYEPFYAFRQKYFHMTQGTPEKKVLIKQSRKKDVIICGSDQIWAPNVFNPVYMLDFVPEKVTKASYAASIGLNQIPDELCKTYTELLSSFQAVAVREKAGADLLQEKCKVQATVVLDPTLLIEQSHWEKLEAKQPLVHEDFVFCYFLNAKHTYREKVELYAKERNLKIVGCSANPADNSWIEKPTDKMGPQEFLWLVHHAKTVITDSYHGTIFSLLYHKDFITFERFASTDKICQNSRIYQLDDYFNISKRILKASDSEALSVPQFDFDVFEEQLSILREQSLRYLKSVLEV